MPQRIYKLEEVAKIFRVDPRTVFRLIHGQNMKGIKLPAVKVGRSWRISENQLKAFIRANANTGLDYIGTDFTKVVVKQKK